MKKIGYVYGVSAPLDSKAAIMAKAAIGMATGSCLTIAPMEGLERVPQNVGDPQPP
jgi:hypothetical protein